MLTLKVSPDEVDAAKNSLEDVFHDDKSTLDRINGFDTFLENQPVKKWVDDIGIYKTIKDNILTWIGILTEESLQKQSDDKNDSVLDIDVEAGEDDAGYIAEFYPDNTKSVLLFFEVAFLGNNAYLNSIDNYLENYPKEFYKDLMKYSRRVDHDSSLLKALYSSTPPYGDFNEKIREILDAILTEQIVNCGYKKVIAAYEKYFNEPNEQGFLEGVTAIIYKSFLDFKRELISLSTSLIRAGYTKVDDSNLRRQYRKIIEENCPYPLVKSNDVPPFLDEVELRGKIDEIAKKCFKNLRLEFLLTLFYRRGEWESGFFKQYCKTTPVAMHNRDKFNKKMGKIANYICDFSNS